MHFLYDTVAIVYNTYNLIEQKCTDLSNTGYNYFPKEFWSFLYFFHTLLHLWYSQLIPSILRKNSLYIFRYAILLQNIRFYLFINLFFFQLVFHKFCIYIWKWLMLGLIKMLKYVFTIVIIIFFCS